MLFQLKEKNKLLSGDRPNNISKLRDMLSKVKYVAKNVIYVKNWSKVTSSSNKEGSASSYKKIKINFSFGTFIVKTINNDDPLMTQAKQLRFESFFGESYNTRTDTDEFDELCDHLVVIDKSVSENYVVGTYRLLLKKFNEKSHKFYSQSEFDISNLLTKKDATLLEAGRSCVRKEYRDGRIIKLLWRALATYIVNSRSNYIFGCASFPSSDSEKFANQLSYLHHYHSPPKTLLTSPLKKLEAKFKLIDKYKIDKESEFRKLPPLIKAYLRVGAYVGSGAIIDKDFNTTDVLIILDSKKLLKKYSDLSIKVN